MKKKSIGNLLSDEKKHLEKLHKIVKESIDAEELIVNNLTHPILEKLYQPPTNWTLVAFLLRKKTQVLFRHKQDEYILV